MIPERHYVCHYHALLSARRHLVQSKKDAHGGATTDSVDAASVRAPLICAPLHTPAPTCLVYSMSATSLPPRHCRHCRSSLSAAPMVQVCTALATGRWPRMPHALSSRCARAWARLSAKESSHRPSSSATCASSSRPTRASSEPRFRALRVSCARRLSLAGAWHAHLFPLLPTHEWMPQSSHVFRLPVRGCASTGPDDDGAVFALAAIATLPPPS